MIVISNILLLRGPWYKEVCIWQRPDLLDGGVIALDRDLGGGCGRQRDGSRNSQPIAGAMEKAVYSLVGIIMEKMMAIV